MRHKEKPSGSEGRKKISELERDIKKMKKDHKETFSEFSVKKSLLRKIADGLLKNK